MLLGTVFGLNPPLFLPLFMLYNVLPALASPLFEASRTSLPLLIVCSRLLPSLDNNRFQYDLMLEHSTLSREGDDSGAMFVAVPFVQLHVSLCDWLHLQAP